MVNMQKDSKMSCYRKICPGKAKSANSYFQKETKKYFFKNTPKSFIPWKCQAIQDLGTEILCLDCA